MVFANAINLFCKEIDTLLSNEIKTSGPVPSSIKNP